MPLSAQQARAAENRRAGRRARRRLRRPTTPTGGPLLAVARHLVDFWTWRSLAVVQGLDDREVVDVAVRLLTATVQHPV